MTRKGRFTEIAAHDLVITTYPLLVRDREVLEAQPFHLAVLDEAQFIKNASTLAARVARDLNVRHRLCLTGTPLENHLGELWSQFNFLTPGLLGDSKAFAKNYRTPIEKHGDQERLNQLTRRLSALILRRTKEQVASELPAKTEIVRSVELLPAQRDLYESIRVSLVALVREEIARRGIAQSQIIILDALLKLRQVCCDPRLVKLESARRVGESAKLGLLLTLLPELLDEGRRVLVFSQFTSMLALIEAELRERGIHYVLLTGDTKDRAAPVERFQNGEVPVFLISLKAGGTGLNLTAADCVIHYDPWWNPAAENQATDRAHRIGQDKPVFVYKLVAMGTVEEKITLMQARKAALAASILGDSEARGGGLVEADIEALFEPLQPIANLA
jgi:SNF2 family DNA or RNA helicase